MPVAKEQIRQIISENNISSVADVYTLLKDSFKDILQELMEAELDATLGYEKNHKGDLQTTNKRNGHSTKNLKSQYGEFQIDVPRDRNGEFESKLIPKYQRDISGIEEKVISLYARGMSTRDIHDQLQDLYGIELSAEMVSKITDKILPQVKEWQSRPLNPVYPFVFMDCIHYKVREDIKRMVQMFSEFIRCFLTELVGLLCLILIIMKKVHRRQIMLIRIINGRMK